jgi:hypothetical protein
MSMVSGTLVKLVIRSELIYNLEVDSNRILEHILHHSSKISLLENSILGIRLLSQLLPIRFLNHLEFAW